MILALLGLLDILVGVSLLFPNFLAFYIGVIILLKGISSIVGSFAVKYFFDVMGFIDVIAGVILLLNFSIPWFWLLLMIKGIYSLIVGIGNR
jgi:uncharacterized membrane protein HdeD (DUF308 family)